MHFLYNYSRVQNKRPPPPPFSSTCYFFRFFQLPQCLSGPFPSYINFHYAQTTETISEIGVKAPRSTVAGDCDGFTIY